MIILTIVLYISFIKCATNVFCLAFESPGNRSNTCVNTKSSRNVHEVKFPTKIRIYVPLSWGAHSPVT